MCADAAEASRVAGARPGLPPLDLPLLARALPFPTAEPDALADETMLYMAHTADFSVRIDAAADDGDDHDSYHVGALHDVPTEGG